MQNNSASEHIWIICYCIFSNLCFPSGGPETLYCFLQLISINLFPSDTFLNILFLLQESCIWRQLFELIDASFTIMCQSWCSLVNLIDLWPERNQFNPKHRLRFLNLQVFSFLPSTKLHKTQTLALVTGGGYNNYILDSVSSSSWVMSVLSAVVVQVQNSPTYATNPCNSTLGLKVSVEQQIGVCQWTCVLQLILYSSCVVL